VDITENVPNAVKATHAAKATMETEATMANETPETACTRILFVQHLPHNWVHLPRFSVESPIKSDVCSVGFLLM